MHKGWRSGLEGTVLSKRAFCEKAAKTALLATALNALPFLSHEGISAESLGFEKDNIGKPLSGRKPKMFDTMEIGLGEPGKYIPRVDSLKAAINQGASGQNEMANAWRQMLATAKDKDPMIQMNMVNGFFNQVKYISDTRGADRWKTPLQFMYEGGDCEDYAIAKFVSLRILGYHPDRIRLVLVDDAVTGQEHAVAAVYYDGYILLLDNMLRSVSYSDNLSNYNPICSLTEKKLWVHWKPGKSGNSVAELQQRFSKKS